MDTPYAIEHRQRVDSTQDVALTLAKSTGGNVLVTADEQVSGRGRAGHQWWQADKNLFMSLAFFPRWAASDWGRIPLVAGVAVVAATQAVFGVAVDLKWPNDLVVGEMKVGGILVEARGDLVVAGFGMNLVWREAPTGATGLLRQAADVTAASTARLANEIAKRLLAVCAADANHWPRTEYIERCSTIGRLITWDGGGPAMAVDVLRGGELLVRTAHGDQRLVASEVRHLRAATLSAGNTGQ